MILKIYAIYDKDGENFNERTFCSPNSKVAIRMIKQTLKNDVILKENAEHYELHEMAQYDTESGIQGNGTTKRVCGLEEMLEEMLGMPEQATPAASVE